MGNTSRSWLLSFPPVFGRLGLVREWSLGFDSRTGSLQTNTSPLVCFVWPLEHLQKWISVQHLKIKKVLKKMRRVHIKIQISRISYENWSLVLRQRPTLAAPFQWGMGSALFQGSPGPLYSFVACLAPVGIGVFWSGGMDQLSFNPP